MSETSKKSKAATLQATGACISSPALAAGPTPLNSPGGQQTGLFGPEAVPASLLARQAKGKVKRTKDTSGRCSFGSSASAALQRSLVNRLQVMMDTDGSPEYEMTWRKRAMQSGAPIFRLAARARRTSGKGCSGWPSPNIANGHETIEQWMARRAEDKTMPKMPLAVAAQLAGWPTPQVFDASDCQPSEKATKRRKAIGGCVNLREFAQMAGWGSPRSSETGLVRTEEAIARARTKGGSVALEDQAHLASGLTPNSYPAVTEKRGVLNPRFSLWLMGFPDAWASCGALAMQSCRKSRQRS